MIPAEQILINRKTKMKKIVSKVEIAENFDVKNLNTINYYSY